MNHIYMYVHICVCAYMCMHGYTHRYILIHIYIISFFSFVFFFLFGCIGSSLLSAGFLQLRRVGGYSSLWCVGFSLRWLLLLWSMGCRCTASVAVARGLSSCGSWALERRLSSRGTLAQLLHGMWNLPGPGVEPMSPALAGGFLTTAPTGKSSNFLLISCNIYFLFQILHFSVLECIFHIFCSFYSLFFIISIFVCVSLIIVMKAA